MITKKKLRVPTSKKNNPPEAGKAQYPNEENAINFSTQDTQPPDPL